MPPLYFCTNREWNGTKFNHNMAGPSHGTMLVTSRDDYAVTRRPPEEFYRELARFSQRFVFIHGFNNTFPEAAHRFSLFATALENAGLRDTAFILLSWPSEGHDVGKVIEWINGSPYTRDRRRMIDSVVFAAAMVTTLVRDGQRLYLMGHSMGGSLLFRLLKALEQETRQRITRIMFMAADVRKNEMQSHFVNRIGRPATNYLCRGDRALELSRKNSGFHKRMGASSTKIHKVPHADRQRLLANIKIPSTLAKTEDKMRHTYFLLRGVVQDVVLQCTTDQTPSQRGLRVRDGEKGWVLPKPNRRPPPKKAARKAKKAQMKQVRRAQKNARVTLDESL